MILKKPRTRKVKQRAVEKKIELKVRTPDYTS